jgi:hypothetical protein
MFCASLLSSTYVLKNCETAVLELNKQYDRLEFNGRTDEEAR